MGRAKLILYAIVAVVILWFWGFNFYNKTHTLLIDNPTWSGIIVQIDGKEDIDIPAFWFKEVDIDLWKHSVSLNGEDIWEFERKMNDTKSFLNPTNEIYLSEYLLYTDSDDEEKVDEYFKNLPNNKIEAYDNEAEWPFKKYEGMYIVWDWEYGLNEAFPEEVDIISWINYTIKQKVYRFDDFLVMYNENYASDDLEESSTTGTWTDIEVTWSDAVTE